MTATTSPATLPDNLPLFNDQSWSLGVVHGSRLLAPIRAAVERAQAVARPLVEPVADGEAYCWTLDFIAEQIETLERIEEAAHDTHRALMDAVHLRDGYEGWPASDLAEHIRRVTALRDALNALCGSVKELREAERAAFTDFANNVVSQPRGRHPDDAGSRANP